MDDTKPNASDKLRDAERSIRYHTAGAAAALLLPIPIPFVDPALLLGVQVNLVRSLAKIYEVPFSENVGKSLISALIGTSVPGATASLLRVVPVVGIVVSSAAGAASTYAIGKVFVQHFESGGTFLTFDPQKVREHYMRETSKRVNNPDPYVVDDFGGIKP